MLLKSNWNHTSWSWWFRSLSMPKIFPCKLVDLLSHMKDLAIKCLLYTWIQPILYIQLPGMGTATPYPFGNYCHHHHIILFSCHGVCYGAQNFHHHLLQLDVNLLSWCHISMIREPMDMIGITNETLFPVGSFGLPTLFPHFKIMHRAK